MHVDLFFSLAFNICKLQTFFVVVLFLALENDKRRPTFLSPLPTINKFSLSLSLLLRTWESGFCYLVSLLPSIQEVYLVYAKEGETGKLYRAKFQDREGRTVLILRPGKQNTNSHEGQLRHLVYMLENATLNLPEGQEQMIWLIDFTGWSLSNAVPMKTARETANILQNHYPERLAVSFLYNPPRVFEAFWKVIKYFLDPKTYQKVNFVYSKNEESIKVMHKYFDPEVLPLEFGGMNKTEYDHEEFSKMMEKDDIKTAAFWGSENKVGPQAEQLTNGSSVVSGREAEGTPCAVAQAS